jgi:hypothetical protein
MFSYCLVVSIVFLLRHSYFLIFSIVNDSFNGIHLLVLIKKSVVCIMIIVSWKKLFTSSQHHWRTIITLVWILIPYKSAKEIVIVYYITYAVCIKIYLDINILHLECCWSICIVLLTLLTSYKILLTTEAL